MTEEYGQIIELRRLDTTLTKADLIQHMKEEHSQVPVPDRVTKETIIGVHRLIHLGLGR